MLRAGLADGVAPSVTMPTVVGRLKKDIESYRHRKDVYVGNELTKKYGLVCVNYPLRGRIMVVQLIFEGQYRPVMNMLCTIR